MKLVQTLLVRDEADIVDTQIAYHLNAGVDFVIATDHESRDGTTEILESYARDGHLRRIPVSGEMLDGPWRSHMAGLAATEHGADWVINTDADEFWISRHGTLKDVLGAVPDSYGVIFALSRHFAPRPDDGAFFAERMTARVSPPAAINDPTSPYRPHLKAAHRADPGIEISFGSHTILRSKWRAIHHWHPAEVLHFPYRSLRQWEKKGVRRARGDKPLGQYVTALRASEGGRGAERFRTLAVDDDALARGRADGSLVVDVRLRDALRALRGKAPREDAPAADRGLISESVAVRDADIVRLTRFVDGLSARVADLEARGR
ncbi:MAG TPA: glycosyltransferase family 2 protein [Gaiellaceae bacterium]|nr:glycosyltransferase family 2 protein [Gaiellaceae bacterium]